ncbi:MAG TPA: hypothetical protein VFX59_12710, partial [Polyangiales bacterium]|nr:hypothetical protein [Polyangiales bacterium]
VVLVIPLAARASCVVGEAELLWSYPAEGARDVPLNATFWMLTTASSLGRPSVWLNDASVPLASERESDVAGVDLNEVRVEPRGLRANTDYTLRVRYPWPDELPGSNFEIHFRTGSAKAKQANKAQVVGRTQISPQDGDALPCHELFGVQGCFDTIGERPAQIQTFELVGGAPIAWFVTTGQGEESILWPAQCGDPALLIHESRGDECFSVRAIGAGGQLAPAIRHCIGPKDAPTRASMRGFIDAGRALTKRAALPRWTPELPRDPTDDSPPEAAPIAAPTPPPAVPVAREGCSLGGDARGPLYGFLLTLLVRRRRPPGA